MASAERRLFRPSLALAAALAAGETPSPELVANARDAGGLRPAVALTLLAVQNQVHRQLLR